MNWKLLRILALIFGATIPAFSAQAPPTTYYVDFASGSDSNDGKSKSSPWQHAPGMNNCSGTCASTTLQAGDSVIFKGGVSWTNDSFPLKPVFGGTSSTTAQGCNGPGCIYYGVDQTWFTGSSWTRPIFDLQGLSTNRGDGLEYVINLRGFGSAGQGFVVFDNIEIKGQLNTCAPSAPPCVDGSNATFHFGVTCQNCEARNLYIHGWHTAYVAMGTGNISSGSCTVTNFVPVATGMNAFSTKWTSVVPGGVKLQTIPQQGHGIPAGNNAPLVSSITGSNPYTVTWTGSGCANATANRVPIQIGVDSLQIFTGNNQSNGPSNIGALVDNNVVDGSDVDVVQLNPYPDCGLTEGNNNYCLASAMFMKAGPQYFRNNVIRFVSQGGVAEATEVSGSLFEYLRPISADPTGHTNVWEQNTDSQVGFVFYNNVVRHTNILNPNVPGGTDGYGIVIQFAPQTGKISAAFNNVIYDTGTPFDNGGSGGAGTGTYYQFNNTIACGIEGNYTSPCFGNLPSYAAHGYSQNNHFITSNTNPIGPCGSNCTATKNLQQSAATAKGQGYTEGEIFAYSAGSGGSTIGAGASITTFCNALNSFPEAQTACLSDTTYGPVYNTTNHSITPGARTAVLRGSTPDIGAYQFGAGDPPPNPPSGLKASVN